jgi:hypothetical protein
MKVTLHWTDAMRRLTRHIADYIEDTESVPHGDMYWLETLMNFRRVEGRATPLDRSVNNDKVAHMFESSGLAGVLLGETLFPKLERRKITSIRLLDQSAAGIFPAELVMGIPSYPHNWKH